jgi:hypothetical protein
LDDENRYQRPEYLICHIIPRPLLPRGFNPGTGRREAFVAEVKARIEDPRRRLFVGEFFFCSQSSSDLDVKPLKLERSTDVIDNPLLFRLTQSVERTRLREQDYT